MPEGYYKREPYPRPGEHWLDKAARQGQLIRCRCKRCHRLVIYVAADLLPILGPQHRAAVDPPFPCRCGEQVRIDIECFTPTESDVGHLEVRRPARREAGTTVEDGSAGRECAERCASPPGPQRWTIRPDR